jgi:hypothetical protein
MRKLRDAVMAWRDSSEGESKTEIAIFVEPIEAIKRDRAERE